LCTENVWKLLYRIYTDKYIYHMLCLTESDIKSVYNKCEHENHKQLR